MTAGRDTMHRERYGRPSEVFEVRDVPMPVPGDDARARARRVAPIVDWYQVVARPLVGRPSMGLRRPKETALGIDDAGVVDAVGPNVRDSGPETRGSAGGPAPSPSTSARVDRAVVPMPANVGFEEAATVAVAGVTSPQGLRDNAGLRPGERVLVNGASGGVGTYAVQVAKALGAS